MNLYRPILSNRITQKFGENKACIKTNINGGISFPTKIVGVYDSICPIGTKPFYKMLGMEGHNGIDIKSWIGEPVYHCADFEGVMKTEIDSSGGIGVDVISNEPLDIYGKKSHIKIRYWHNKIIIGWDGKKVKPGDLIALAGNTGASSSPHLHWAPKWCDEKGNGARKNNGFLGAFDPAPFYQNIFIRKVLGLSSKRLGLAQQASKLVFQANELLRIILKGRHYKK